MAPWRLRVSGPRTRTAVCGADDLFVNGAYMPGNTSLPRTDVGKQDRLHESDSGQRDVWPRHLDRNEELVRGVLEAAPTDDVDRGVGLDGVDPQRAPERRRDDDRMEIG